MQNASILTHMKLSLRPVQTIFFPQRAYAFPFKRQVVPLTFESVDEMLLCYHSNETSLSDRFLSIIYFLEFLKENFEFLGVQK